MNYERLPCWSPLFTKTSKINYNWTSFKENTLILYACILCLRCLETTQYSICNHIRNAWHSMTLIYFLFSSFPPIGIHIWAIEVFGNVFARSMSKITRFSGWRCCHVVTCCWSKPFITRMAGKTSDVITYNLIAC